MVKTEEGWIILSFRHKVPIRTDRRDLGVMTKREERPIVVG